MCALGVRRGWNLARGHRAAARLRALKRRSHAREEAGHVDDTSYMVVTEGDHHELSLNQLDGEEQLALCKDL